MSATSSKSSKYGSSAVKSDSYKKTILNSVSNKSKIVSARDLLPKGKTLGDVLKHVEGLGETRVRVLLKSIGVGNGREYNTRGRMYVAKNEAGTTSMAQGKKIVIPHMRQLQELYTRLTIERKEKEIDDTLREKVLKNIQTKKRLRTREGSRHTNKLPIKGRTRSNANTRKKMNY